jgi:signal peptidase II
LLRRFLPLAALVLVLDQATKWLVLDAFDHLPGAGGGPWACVPAGRAMPVISGFFELVLSCNRGISFGILNREDPAIPWILSALTVAIVAVLLLWLRRAENRWIALGLGLVIGGALGNLADRVALGAVVDFLHFFAGRYSFPAFNLADSAITLGVAALLVDSLFGRRKSPK